ncbi:MAG: AprI/Inh family metalloprotease inhibitor [Caulobacteraceae bacterium]
MKLRIAFTLVALVLLARAALAGQVDYKAGVPLAPSDAAGGWTVESHGRSVCMIDLSPARTAAGPFGAHLRGDCAGTLPPNVAGWTPISGGMALTGPQGRVLLPFERWSDSLFVARISTGDNVQLMRGGPHPQAAPAAPMQ